VGLPRAARIDLVASAGAISALGRSRPAQRADDSVGSLHGLHPGGGDVPGLFFSLSRQSLGWLG
jgi:hypothetical protein